MAGVVSGYRLERFFRFPRHIWIGDAVPATGIVFDQAGALSIQIVPGVVSIWIERKDECGDKATINACALQQRKLIDEPARLHALVALVNLLQAGPNEAPHQWQLVQEARQVIDVPQR